MVNSVSCNVSMRGPSITFKSTSGAAKHLTITTNTSWFATVCKTLGPISPLSNIWNAHSPNRHFRCSKISRKKSSLPGRPNSTGGWPRGIRMAWKASSGPSSSSLSQLMEFGKLKRTFLQLKNLQNSSKMLKDVLKLLKATWQARLLTHQQTHLWSPRSAKIHSQDRRLTKPSIWPFGSIRVYCRVLSRSLGEAVWHCFFTGWLCTSLVTIFQWVNLLEKSIQSEGQPGQPPSQKQLFFLTNGIFKHSHPTAILEDLGHDLPRLQRLSCRGFRFPLRGLPHRRGGRGDGCSDLGQSPQKWPKDTKRKIIWKQPQEFFWGKTVVEEFILPSWIWRVDLETTGFKHYWHRTKRIIPVVRQSDTGHISSIPHAGKHTAALFDSGEEETALPLKGKVARTDGVGIGNDRGPHQ